MSLVKLRPFVKNEAPAQVRGLWFSVAFPRKEEAATGADGRSDPARRAESRVDQ